MSTQVTFKTNDHPIYSMEHCFQFQVSNYSVSPLIIKKTLKALRGLAGVAAVSQVCQQVAEAMSMLSVLIMDI